MNKKYPNLPGSKEVSRAVEVAKKDPERIRAPHTKIERTQAYLDRIDRIIDDPRGWQLLSQKIRKDMTLELDNPEILQKTINLLHHIDVNTAIDGGQKQEIQKLGQLSQETINETYRSGAFERKGSQLASLDEWMNYLQQNDAEYPTWFRYFVMRNLGKMGRLDKEKNIYSKRSKTSLDAFPDLNAEALANVYRILNKGLGSKEYLYDPERDTPEQEQEIKNKRSHVETLLAKKDFVGLYAFAQMESEGNSNRESLDGEWRVFPQNSNPEELVETLARKGTGWCTASGSAPAHLKGGDFHVYYTLGNQGVYSEPRIAIRMENGRVREVRGVAHRQAMEAELLETAQERYQSLPGGDKFEKKSADMKYVTELVKKQKRGEDFSDEDLQFLYELDHPIEGFGYTKDVRVTELLEERNERQDLSKLFHCRPEQIALSKEEALSGNIVYFKGDLDLSSLNSAQDLILPERIGGGLDLSGLNFEDRELLRKKYPQHAEKI